MGILVIDMMTFENLSVGQCFISIFYMIAGGLWHSNLEDLFLSPPTI